MSRIKTRRLEELTLESHPTLHVGDCTPFYFCPRSLMLYILWQAHHPDLAYRGGQVPIIHLEADLNRVIEWADANDRRWAFTLSNAGSYYFEDRADLEDLGHLDWDAIVAKNWTHCKDEKQAEFLIESNLPWHLIERIGIHRNANYSAVAQALPEGGHRPTIEVMDDWYY